MNIGLFFGSFNPVHAGHMIIANYMAQFTGLEQVWLVISPQNPLKQKETLLSDIHRLRLVREAVYESRYLKACDIEFGLPKPSYTIDTLTYLNEKYPEHTFALIMGSDSLETLPKWKNHEMILSRYKIFVYPRTGSDGGALKNHPNVQFTKTPLVEISSTFIRDAIRDKKDVRHFLPEKVYACVSEMHFYEKVKK